MGFNKRIISKKTLKVVSQYDYEFFYNYFKTDAIISDDFSSNIVDEINNCSITDKDRIVEIMKKCK